jgi:hypothetical protein
MKEMKRCRYRRLYRPKTPQKEVNRANSASGIDVTRRRPWNSHVPPTLQIMAKIALEMPRLPFSCNISPYHADVPREPIITKFGSR